MREIKFRAKEKDGHWIYSDKCGLDLFFALVLAHKLEPQEYTGLKDKSGQEIYEGDILLSSKGNLLCLVTFDDGKFGWNIRYKKPEPNQRKDCFGRSYGNQDEANKLEVIGNIYENSDLLES